MRPLQALVLAVVSTSCVGVGAHTPSDAAVAEAYDVVIAGGRVVDPESGLDGVRNVGIRGDTIAVVTAAAIRGRDTVEAAGLVVAPGFVDLHQHAQDSAAYAVLARAGVTTAFELEEGPADVDAWYTARAGRAHINYGASVGHAAVRERVVRDTRTGASPATPVEGRAPTGDAATRAATEAELAAVLRGIDAGLRDGAVAVGVLLGYTPGARPWEVFEVFRVAARHGASVHVHVRDVPEALYYLEFEEVLAAAAASGAAAHIVHLQSSAAEDTPGTLEMLHGARARGIDVTTEMYPYTAGMTGIEGAAFADWERRADAWFRRVEWPATGERLTRERFRHFRAQGGNVVIHPADSLAAEAWVRAAVRDPLPMIASDGILSGGVGHPRVAGTHARILGLHVRERGDLTLMEALRRMSLEPARRLERRVPAMRRKGRVQVGADADLVVFDPATVRDAATFRDPARPPTGIPYVLVRGTVVVRQGALVPRALPGRPIRAAPRERVP